MTGYRRFFTPLAMAALVTAATVAWEVPDTEACGPWFPNQVLWNPDTVLRMPAADLEREVRGLAKKGAPVNVFKPLNYQSPRDFTLKAEVNDLRAALKEASMADNEIRGRLVALSVARERIMSQRPVGTLAPALPQEFQLYLEGAGHFRAGQMEQAAERWRTLLKLPSKERRWRSTWAAFMLGKAAQRSSDRRAAVRHYREVRKLVASGMKDSLGLANTSLGWEARAAAGMGQHAEAVALYAQQAVGGDPGAIVSLDVAIKGLLKNPKQLEMAARRSAVRAIVSAWFTNAPAEPGVRASFKAWLGVHKKAGVKDTRSARMLAWALYQAGDYKEARGWLDLAPPKDAVTLWLKAKLELREGRIKPALALLAEAARAMPSKARWNAAGAYSPAVPKHLILGDAGVVALSQKDFVGALDMLYRGKHWEDAAYVAERVLTVDELKRYVDKHWAKPTAGNQQLRSLLARRMVRAGDLKGATPYTAKEVVDHLKALKAHSAGAKRGSSKKRALKLWEMAKVMRHWGMELMGTELYPDFAHYGGAFLLDDTLQVRHPRSALGPTPSKWGASAEEIKRAKASGVVPNKRFHYRYKAAGLGWRAASKLKDDTVLKASILCQAGTWLKYRAPQAADPFYKAMVRKNPTVKLAMGADRMRWFPPICGAP